jgi:anti-sigma factor RsiW
MTCRDLTDFLQAYVAHDLADDVRIAFDRHVSDCHDCRVFLVQYEATIVAGRQAYAAIEDAPVPDDLVRAILRAIDDDPDR